MVTRERLIGPLFLIALIFLSLAARYSLLPFISRDVVNFLGPWYDFIMRNGRIQSFRFQFADYSPPYLHMLAFSTFLPFSKIVSIKLVSILFDFLMAGVVYMIVRIKYSAVIAWGAFLATVFAPTVLLNSALWAQCDAILTTFILLSVYFLMRGQSFWAVLAFAIGFSIKFQAVFFLPVLFIFWLRRKIPTLTFLLIPAVVLITFIPSLIVGRPFRELALVYFNQAELYRRLFMGAPNLYQWFSNDYFDYLYLTGLSVTVALFLALSYAVYRSPRALTPSVTVKLSLLTVLGAAFFLPKMHERYFYLADVTAIAYAFYSPGRFYVPIVIGLASLFSYLPFLFGITVIPLPLVALALLAMILVVLIDLIADLRPAGEEETPSGVGEPVSARSAAGS
jgi:Gpi18-like mannosyltransferase